MYEKKVAMLAMVVCSVVFTRMVDAEASEDIKEILTSGDYEYCILDDGTIQITNFYGSADQLEIPDEIDGKMVSEIGNRAFSSCKNLTGIKIPDSVIEIDDYAFVGSRITDIEVDANNKCFDVIDGVLYDIDEKELIYYPCGFTEEHFSVPQGIEKIGYYAFWGGSSLTSIEIPDSVTEIGHWAFLICERLTRIEVDEGNKSFDVIDGVLYDIDEKELIYYPCGFTTEIFSIPQGIKKIGYGAFANGSNLISIEIPDSVTEIDTCAFDSCVNLINIEIPDSVTEIGYGAFYDCSSLTSIEIPNSVTEIGDNAFHGCENLKITAADGSYAIQYAIDNGIDYEYVGQHDWLNN